MLENSSQCRAPFPLREMYMSMSQEDEVGMELVVAGK